MMLLVPCLAQERDAGASAQAAVPAVAADEVARLDFCALPCVCDRCDDAFCMLGKADQLAVHIHLHALRCQTRTQRGLSMLLADHQRSTIGSVRCWER